MEPTPAQREAEEIYIRALAASSAVRIEALVTEYPACADELLDLHASWSRVEHIHDVLSGAGSLATRLRRRYGDAVEADLELSGAELLEDSAAAAAVRKLEQQPQRSRYRTLNEVARGGMGSVLRVWDSDLRRTIAMKVMLERKVEVKDAETRVASDRAVSRFLEEAQVTGQLDHPGIVPVHELGLDDGGQLFFTMRLVRGRDLEQVLRAFDRGDEEWTVNRLLRVLLRVCEAMAFAHSKGVVHRDLKPANVMVGRFGEVYVMDWGLARVIGREDKRDLRLQTPALSIVQTARAEERETGDLSPLMTMDGEVLGTPAYMSPEQALGDLHQLDQRADVYSVGAILYHILSGHMPYVAKGERLGAFAVWDRVKKGPPSGLDVEAPGAPAELVAIAEKAMQREASARYPSMKELAEDLANFLDGHVVRAYESGGFAELRKWVRRNRATSLASAAAVALALVGLGSISYVEARANRDLEDKNTELVVANDAAETAREDAEVEKQRADDNARLAEEKRGEAEAREREAASERDAGERVIEFLAGLFESPDPSRTRGAEVTAKELLDHGAQSIEDGAGGDPIVWGRLRVAMGRAYHSLGLYDESTPLLERVWRDRRDLLGADDIATLLAEKDLAEVYLDQGRYDEAEPLLLHALDSGRDRFGPDAEETFTTLASLGKLRFWLGDYPLAADRLGQAIAGLRALRGDGAPVTLRAVRMLALVHRKEKRYDDAQDLFEEARDGFLAAQGADHPETLRAMNDVAGVYMFQERLEEAQDLFHEVLEGRVRVLGELHPDTLTTINDLAYLTLQLDDFEEAEALYRRAVQGKREALGDTHPETLTSINNLAVLLYQKGRFAGAQPLFEEALRGTLEARGEEHPNTVAALHGVASVLYSRTKYEESEPYFERAYAAARAVHGDDDELTQVILNSYAKMKVRIADWEGAEPLARELLLRTPRTHPQYKEREGLLDRVRDALKE
ncbi:MAG: serine/threonine-protein kinase [Planctomycetota bacterium]